MPRITNGQAVAGLRRAAGLPGLMLALMLAMMSASAWAERIKDLASVQGVRNNQLVGYGQMCIRDRRKAVPSAKRR